MATHDYVIDNGTGAAVRTDINNVLSAIVSNNSSSSEPSTKYAYQWWADTTTGILKIRNSSNGGFTEIGSIDSANLGLLPRSGGTSSPMTGQFLADDSNSASTPAISFDTDSDLGLFRKSANIMGF